MPFVTLNKSKLHYRVYGSGAKVLFAFHGYGQESIYFKEMSQVLGAEYKVFAFDLFFHGQSYLNKQDMPLTKKHLLSFMQALFQEEQVDRFSIMAFSMGGKFALTLLEKYPEKIDRIFLIAPDGIHTNFWYNIATYPGWLQGLFKRTVINPTLFFNILDTLHRYKVVDKSLARFAEFQMNSTPKRLRVYKSWIGFKDLSFDLRKIVNLINTHQIHVTVFLGEYDQIISRKRVEAFVKAIKSAHLILLKAGHSHLIQDVAIYIRRNGHILDKHQLKK